MVAEGEQGEVGAHRRGGVGEAAAGKIHVALKLEQETAIFTAV